jgi:hypothetical protein
MAAVKQPRALGELQLKAEAAKTTTQDTPEQLSGSSFSRRSGKKCGRSRFLGV